MYADSNGQSIRSNGFQTVAFGSAPTISNTDRYP